MTKVSKNTTDDHVIIDWSEDNGIEAMVSSDGGEYKELSERYARSSDQDFLDLGTKWTDKSEGMANWRELVGSRLTEDNIEDIFVALTTNPNGNALGGIELVGLTDDSFTITVEGKFGTDKFTFGGEKVEALFEKFDDEDGGRISGFEAEFDVITPDFDGPTSLNRIDINIPLDGESFGNGKITTNSKANVETLLELAIDVNSEDVKLITLDTDSFSVQIANQGNNKNPLTDGFDGPVDTYLFQGEDVAALLAERLVESTLNTRNSSDEFQFLPADEIAAAEASSVPTIVGGNNGSSASNTNAMQEVAAVVGNDIRINSNVNNVEELILAADELPQVTVQDMGLTTAVFIENADTGAQDLIVYGDPTIPFVDIA